MSVVSTVEIEFFTDDLGEAREATLEIAELIFDREDVNIVAGSTLEHGTLEE